MKLFVSSVSLFLVMFYYSCNPLDPITQAIDNAISQLTQQSQQWQATLTQLENTLHRARPVHYR